MADFEIWRSEAIDQEVSRLLYETGCRNISYAPESGSEETLVAIKKKVSLPRMMDSMRGAVRNGLNVKANFIFGFPNEGWKNIWFFFTDAHFCEHFHNIGYHIASFLNYDSIANAHIEPLDFVFVVKRSSRDS